MQGLAIHHKTIERGLQRICISTIKQDDGFHYVISIYVDGDLIYAYESRMSYTTRLVCMRVAIQNVDL